MGGHSFAFMESFDRGGGQPDIESLMQKLVRHTVVMVVHFNMIIEVYPGLMPFGIFIRSGR